MKILIVEDDATVAQAIEALLASHHYAVDRAVDGQAGWEMVDAYSYDLLLLDIGLPQIDGVSLCRQLRTEGVQTPILLLTGQETEGSAKAIALNAGADDYVTKPFDADELLARIQSLLRRGDLRAPPTLRWGALSLDPSRLQVSYRDTLLYLTPKEYSLLEVLLRHAPKILSARTILEQGWSALEAPGEETVRVHLKGLRKKLKAAGAPKDFIKTVHRQGYRLNPLYGETTFSGQEEPATPMQMAELKAVNEELRHTLEQLQVSKLETEMSIDLGALALLRSLSTRRVTSGNPQELYDDIVAAAMTLTEAEAGTLQLFESGTQELVLLAAAGFEPPMTEFFARVSASSTTPCGIALATGQRTFLDFDVPASGDPDGSLDMHRDAGYLSAQSTPLLNRLGHPVGMISTHWRDHHRPSDWQLWFLDLLARQVVDLIEQWRTNSALQEREAQISQIFDNAGAAIGEFTAYPDRTYVHGLMSVGCEAVYGYSQAEMTGDSSLWQSRVVPEDMEMVIIPAYEQIFAGNSFSVEYRFRDKTDAIRWIAETLNSQWDETAGCWRVTTVAIDISDLKQAELNLQQQIRQEQLLADIAQEIRQSLELDQLLRSTVDRVRALLDCDRVIIFRFRPDWQGEVIMEAVGDECVAIQSNTIVDPCFKDRFIERYRQGHVSVLNDINQPDLDPCYAEMLRQFQVQASLAVPILRGNDLWGLLMAHQCSGPRQWQPNEIEMLQRLATQVGIASQKAELYTQVRQELTQRAHMQAVLQESEERFRTLSAAAPVGILQANADGICLYANDAWQRMSGLSLANSLGNGWLQGIHPEDRAWVSQDWEAYVQDQREGRAEFRLLTPNQKTCWISARIAAIKSANDDIVGYVSTYADITERKQAEEALRDSEQRLQAILDYSPAVIYLLDLQNRHLLVNRMYAEQLATTPAEIIGKSLDEIWPTETAESFANQNLTVLETGKLLQIEDTAPLADGIHSYLTVKFPLYDATGKIYAICGLSTDITERKNLEAQFYQAQRLESIGTMASGIAHDLNNILAPILTTAQLLRLTQKGLDAKGLKFVTMLENSAKKGANLVKQILSVSRTSKGERTALDLGALLRDEIEIIQHGFPKSIEILADVPSSKQNQPALGMILADPTYLHQIILNLCINARDAMPDGGTLTVSAAKAFVDETMAGQNLDAQVGDYAVVTVADTGTGIPPEVKARIFDPFFTTKAPGQGTGLGLATVRGLVKANEGFLQVFSEVGQGTQFKIFFPLMESDGPEQDPVDP